VNAFNQNLHQIIFSTKNRKPVLIKNNRPTLFKYIWGIIKNKKCHLYRINGVEDHLHILVFLHQTVAIASLVKDIKVASSLFIKQKGVFPAFEGWQRGYGSFSYSICEKNRLIEYIKNQEEHHKKVSYREEVIALLEEQGLCFDEQYLE